MKTAVYDTIENIDRNQWNNFVRKSELGCFFHLYEWLKAVEDGLDMKPRHIIVFKGGAIIGCMPNFIAGIEKLPFKRMVSIRPGYGGPLIATQEKEVFDLMLKEVSRICGGNVISHLISTSDFGYTRYGAYLEEKGYHPRLTGCTFKLELKGKWDDIQANMDKGRRYNLKKGHSIKHKIIDLDINEKNLRKFYDMYKRVMNRVGGRPYPFVFFKNLKKFLKDYLKLFTIEMEDQYCGGYLHFLDKKNLSILHFFGAVKENCFKHYPNELLHEFSIKWGLKNKFKHYDFGGTPALFSHGLFKFKQEFGGQVIPTLSWEKGYSKLRWNLFKLGRRFHKKVRG